MSHRKTNAGYFLKVQILGIPSFNRKSLDWPTFYKKFTSIVQLQGLDDVLAEDPNHHSWFLNDLDYASKCVQLYTILKHICTGGLALPKVSAYQNTKDGHSAWLKLCTHYYAKGDVQSYAKACLE